MRTRPIKFAGSTGIGLMFLSLVAVAAGPCQAAGDRLPSLDQLLDLVAPTTGPAPPGGERPSPGAERGLMEQLSDRQPAGVFGQAVVQMDQAAARIADDLDVGLKTQRIQESILAKLDQVIAAAKKPSSRSGSGGEGSASPSEQDTGSGQNASQGNDAQAGGGPQAAATGGSGGGGKQAAISGSGGAALEDHRQRWGDLPERLREDLLQGINERFSSVYEELTSQYYRRLAGEGQQ